MVWSVTIYPIKAYSNKYQTPKIATKSSGDSDVRSVSQWESIVSQDVNNLHSFMRFLCRSFCVENMLFLIETMQFKQEFIRKYVDDGIHGNTTPESPDSDNTLDFGSIIYLYDENKQNEEVIPKSSIVYGQNKYNLHEQIRMIYDKYISDQASLQINISGSLKKNLSVIEDESFERNQDKQYLITIFDEAIDEMRYLLINSFLIFKTESLSPEDVESDLSDMNEQIMIAITNSPRARSQEN